VSVNTLASLLFAEANTFCGSQMRHLKLGVGWKCRHFIVMRQLEAPGRQIESTKTKQGVFVRAIVRCAMRLGKLRACAQDRMQLSEVCWNKDRNEMTTDNICEHPNRTGGVMTSHHPPSDWIPFITHESM
jgi:hypothetical protein